MSRTQVKSDAATEASSAPAVPMRLEVVVIVVADVDRAKAFYEGLGWRLDADVAGGDDYMDARQGGGTPDEASAPPTVTWRRSRAWSCHPPELYSPPL